MSTSFCLDSKKSTTCILFEETNASIGSIHSTSIGGNRSRGLTKKSAHINEIQTEVLTSRTHLANNNRETLPLISIIIVTFNAESHLSAAIESILEQDYPNIELIIVDGASTDNTVKIIQSYDKYIDFWISEKDSGIYNAMNKAIPFAKGDWIYFLGSDDLLNDDFSLAAYQLHKPNTIYYGSVFMPLRKKTYDGPFSKLRLMRKNICHQAILYPRTAFDNETFNEKYRVLADYHFNMICFNTPNLKSQYLPLTLATFNDETGSSSLSIDQEFNNDYWKILKENFPTWLYHFFKIKHSLRKKRKQLKEKSYPFK